MDDRIYDEFGAKRRSGPSADIPKRNPRQGEFKLSIDFDAIEREQVRQAGKAQNTASRQAEDFRVSLPKEQKGSASQVKSAQGRTSDSQKSKTASSGKAQSKNASASKKSAAGKTASSRQKLTPQQIAKAKQMKKYKRTRSLLVSCVCLVFIAIVTTVLSVTALQTIDDILAIRSKPGETVSVVIPEGAKFDEVYNVLCEADLVKQKQLVKFFCTKVRSYDNYWSQKQQKYIDVAYTPGVYYFEPGEGVEVMLEQIKTSSTVSKDTVRITFPEGWTVAQIFEKIEKYNVCTAEKLYANLEVAGKQFEFYKDIAERDNRYLKAEGYLFPDTYDFYIGESANSVLKKLFNNFNNKWTKAFDNQAKKLGMTQDEIIILASIIEGEAKGESQMGGVSSVLHNRLKNSATYPLLQMNSTKDYILSLKDYDVLNDYYYALYLDSYNTYSSQGLPPGSICNPGIDAIKAALYPDDTNYLFFCHDKDGVIYYAATAAEHQKNIEKNLYD